VWSIITGLSWGFENKENIYLNYIYFLATPFSAVILTFLVREYTNGNFILLYNSVNCAGKFDCSSFWLRRSQVTCSWCIIIYSMEAPEITIHTSYKFHRRTLRLLHRIKHICRLLIFIPVTFCSAQFTLYPGVWHRIVWYNFTDVSVETTASVFSPTKEALHSSAICHISTRLHGVTSKTSVSIFCSHHRENKSHNFRTVYK
jgi:hypothetical protein